MIDSTLTPSADRYPDPGTAGRQPQSDGQPWASDPAAPRKTTLAKAYAWWLPLGIFGAHHFYMGRRVWGFITAFTLNFLLLGWALDGILMPYWFARVEKDRQLVQEMKSGLAQTSEALGQAGREIGSASVEFGKTVGPAIVESAKLLGPVTVEASVRLGRAIRLGGIAMSRDKRELIYQSHSIPTSYARVSVVTGAPGSRMSGSNVVGGAVIGGMLGHAGAGAVVGATARTNVTKVYIIVDFPGGQWTAETPQKNEGYARRFASKVNSL